MVNYIRKTIIKAIIIYALIALLFSWFFIMIPLPSYYTQFQRCSSLPSTSIEEMRTHTMKENSLDYWKLGVWRVQREVTFDRHHDVHVQQGFLAKLFRCGSVVFVTTVGLEVGYIGACGGARIGRGEVILGGGALPVLVRVCMEFLHGH